MRPTATGHSSRSTDQLLQQLQCDALGPLQQHEWRSAQAAATSSGEHSDAGTWEATRPDMRWRARGGHDTESIGRDRSQVPTEAQLTRNMGRPGYRGISFRVCRTLRGVYPIGLASVPIFLLNALCLCLSPPTFNRHSNPLTSQPSPNHILAIHTNLHINTPVRPQDIASLCFSSVFRALSTVEHYQPNQALSISHQIIMAEVLSPSIWPVQARTITRKQKQNSLLSTPVPACASTEWKFEYYKITWMLRELIALEPLNGPQKWKQDLLIEALRLLYSIENSTDLPVVKREDHIKWTDVMVRRIIAESLWEEDSTVSFYDCCEHLRTGRSKAGAARLFQQARTSWTAITQTDIGTEFSLAA